MRKKEGKIYWKFERIDKSLDIKAVGRTINNSEEFENYNQTNIILDIDRCQHFF